jgi:predicted peptidase
MRTPFVISVLLAASLTACTGLSPGSDPIRLAISEARLVRQPYTSSTGEPCDYFVYLPVGYDSTPERRWPVMLFLHGDGERGNAREDLDWVLVHGPLYEAWIQKRDLPFVILSPQLPLFGRDLTVDYIRNRDREQIPRRLAVGVPPRPEEFPTPGPMLGATLDPDLPLGPEGPPDGWPQREQDLLSILDQALSLYRTDPNRVYLTGISYGGFGTWHLAAGHPERFAAIAPVVGWGHPELMGPLAARSMPVWVFAGGRDPAVPTRYFYAGLNELERLGHGEVRFTVHADSGHDAWRRVYAGRDLYDWFLEHQSADGASR